MTVEGHNISIPDEGWTIHCPVDPTAITFFLKSCIFFSVFDHVNLIARGSYVERGVTALHVRVLVGSFHFVLDMASDEIIVKILLAQLFRQLAGKAFSENLVALNHAPNRDYHLPGNPHNDGAPLRPGLQGGACKMWNFNVLTNVRSFMRLAFSLSKLQICQDTSEGNWLAILFRLPRRPRCPLPGCVENCTANVLLMISILSHCEARDHTLAHADTGSMRPTHADFATCHILGEIINATILLCNSPNGV